LLPGSFQIANILEAEKMGNGIFVLH